MSKSSIDVLRRLPFAALAIACGSAFGAQVNPNVTTALRQDGRAEVLLVLAEQCTPMLAPF